MSRISVVFPHWAKGGLWRVATGICLTLLLTGATALEAQQTGSVTGMVSNQATGQGIPSAQISLIGTQLGGLATANGRYLLLNVPTGTYTVRAEILGFEAMEQQVTVTAGAAATADFALSIQAISMDELVVTGTAGASRRREIGNSVATVDIQKLSQVKSASILLPMMTVLDVSEIHPLNAVAIKLMVRSPDEA